MRQMSLLVSLALLALTCDSSVSVEPEASEPVSVPFQNVEGFGGFSIPGSGLLVIRDSISFQKLYDQNGPRGGTTGPPPAPEVDFEERMVIAVLYSARSVCSSAVETIERIQLRRDTLFVALREPPDVICLGWGEPVHMVKLERMDRPVVLTGILPN